jgi:predicted DNA-binding protein (MmcQ/YjbR family)
MKSLRTLASKLPDVEEGIACKGNSLECTTFKVGGKAFLFLGRADIRLKLSDSLPDAVKLAKKEPERFSAGAGGWVKVSYSDAQPLPLDVVKGWIEESYRLMAPKNSPAKPKGKTKKKSPT